MQGAESLIQLSRVDVEDWQARLSWESTYQNPTHSVSAEAIIATVPIALFSHEYKGKLRQNLQQIVTIWQDDPELQDGALAVGYAIAQSMREKLNPAVLIDKILAFLENSQTPLGLQLRQVQSLLEQSVGLKTSVAQLSLDHSPKTTPIAIAFYCFLSTLEDFRLSVTRAALSGYQPRITGAITGALSGAYNSTAGIPPGWYGALNEPHHTSSREILLLADRLLAVWSGVYEVTSAESTQLMSAVAAPRVIQPR